MPAGRPLKFSSPEELQAKIDEYFHSFDEGGINRDKPITITGLALWLGTYRDVLCDYQEKDEFSNTIKTAKLRVEQYAEERLYSGPATGPIFALKNFGWKDTQDHNLGGQKDNPIVSEVKLSPDEAYRRMLSGE